MCHDSDSSEGFEVEAIYGYSRTRKEVAVKWKGCVCGKLGARGTFCPPSTSRLMLRV
jgi:hypothetical protein